MGRLIDLDHPLSDEDKQYLRDRGRAHEIPANERRFGVNGDESPVEGEEAGAPADSATFDTDQRDEAFLDVGGAPLPGQILDADTGRVVPLTARTDEGFDVTSEEGDDFDPTIIAEVEAISNVTELKKRLKDEDIEFSSTDNRDELENKLIIGLQDKRDGKVPESDAPDGGGPLGDPPSND